VIKARY